jgi:hypothetical protein
VRGCERRKIMFEYISIKQQLIKEKNLNTIQRAANAELAANMDYLSMMCGVELDDESEEVCEDEQELS